MSRAEGWFDRLYGRYHNHVLAYCLRRVPRSEAFDATAKVFTIAWQRRDDVPSGDRALPWLYGTARNVVAHEWRSARRRQRLAGRAVSLATPLGPDPAVVVVEREEYSMVREAVSRLRDIDREVLLLSAWEGLSRIDIAEMLGSSVAAVDKRITRAKQRLARAYEALESSHRHRPPANAAGGGDMR